MSNLNANIILQGRQPDLMGSYARGLSTGNALNQINRQREVQDIYRQHGAGAMQGNQNALAAIAGVDPAAAQNLMAGQLSMDQTRQRMDILNAQEMRAIESFKAEKGAAAAAAEAAKIEAAVKQGLALQTPQQWDAFMAQNAPDLVGQFAQKDAIANKFMTMAEILKRQDGALDGLPAAYDALRRRALDAGLQPGTPDYQAFMLNAGGDPATFRALDMQAQSAGLAPGTPEYQDFMATRGAGIAAGAKTTAQNLANIDTGGEAARVVAAGAAQGKADVESGRELAEMQRNMPGLMLVVGKLEELADKATYTKVGRLRDEAIKQAGGDATPGAVARAEYIAMVDNQVLPLLRQTFGAAFTQKEGESLKNTLGDPDKSPEEKKAVLRAFIAQKERDLTARGGTVPGQNDTVSTNQELPQAGQVEDGYRFKGGDPANPNSWEKVN